MHTYIHARTRTHTYTLIHTHKYTHIRTHTHIHTRMHTHLYTHTHTCTHIHSHTHTHMTSGCLILQIRLLTVILHECFHCKLLYATALDLWSQLSLIIIAFDHTYLWSWLSLITAIFDHSYLSPQLPLITVSFNHSYMIDLLHNCLWSQT